MCTCQRLLLLYSINKLGLRMCIMPRAAPCAWVSSRRTTVESNMKVYIWLVKTLHNVLFFGLYLVLFLPSWLLLYIDFVAFTFSMSPTVGCIQHSTPQNTHFAEDQQHCPPRPPLSRSAVLPCPWLALCPGPTQKIRKGAWSHLKTISYVLSQHIK